MNNNNDDRFIDVLQAMKHFEDVMHEYLWHNQQELANLAKIKYLYYKKLHDNGELYDPLF